MKLVTEFSVFSLKGPAAQHAELVAAGKTPEEIEAALGEALKLEGDKLKHLVRSLEASAGKTDGLKRVLVATFAEGEKIPPKAHKVEEHYYVLEGFAAARAPAPPPEKGGRGGRGGKGRGGPGGGGGRGGPGGGRGPGGPGGGRGPGGPGAGGGAPKA